MPIQKTLRVEAACPAERVSISYVVNADRQDGYVAILFYSNKFSAKQGFAFPKCEQLRVFTDEITRGAMSIGDTHDFQQTRRTPNDKDKKIILNEATNTGWMSFDTSSIDPKTSSFSLNIPIDALLTRNGADTWALDLDIVSIFPESKTVPDGILPYMLEVLTDPDLIIDSVEPALVRTRPRQNIPESEAKLTMELANREVIGNDKVLLGVDDVTQLNTINQTRLRMQLRDPDYSVKRDVGILVLSTLFGIAVTLLFETMLVLSVRQSLKLSNGQKTRVESDDEQ